MDSWSSSSFYHALTHTSVLRHTKAAFQSAQLGLAWFVTRISLAMSGFTTYIHTPYCTNLRSLPVMPLLCRFSKALSSPATSDPCLSTLQPKRGFSAGLLADASGLQSFAGTSRDPRILESATLACRTYVSPHPARPRQSSRSEGSMITLILPWGK